MKQYASRSEVPEKYKWDLTPYYKTDEDFEDSFNKCSKQIKELSKFKGCTKDTKKLYEFLKLEISIIKELYNLNIYAMTTSDEDLSNSENQARMIKTDNLFTEYNSVTSFFSPELLKLTKEEYEALFEDDNLKEYKKMLDETYREKEHVLSEREEKIITMLSSVNHNEEISSKLLNSNHNYGKVKVENESVTIATNNYRKLMQNEDVNVRKKTYQNFNKKLKEYASTNAGLLSSYAQMNNYVNKIRGFKSSFDAKLFHLELSKKVFDNLKDAAFNNLEPINRYYELKKEVLKVDKIKPYDMGLDITNSKREYSIEEAQELCLEAVKPLGQDYFKKFKKIFDERYIDYCQYKGKCSGAYSISGIDKESRILMSFNNDLDSVSTIIHEGGHNVHHQYLIESNKEQYREQKSIVAEVASLTNECLLSSYIANNAKTKEEKLAGINNMLRVFTSNFYGAIREGKIEEDFYKEVEKNGSVTAEFLDKKTKSYLKKYYGPSVQTDKYTSNGWITRSHYYMNFYLYSYSICISVATYVANKILNGDKEMLEKYINFLKTGMDHNPKETFEVLGINLEEKEVYEEAVKYFDGLITKFREIYNS